LHETFDVPVTFANDTDACTMGEKWVGSARRANTAVGVFVGTGIGGGILVNRKLLRGTRYSAAEIGHITMDPDGPTCNCGNPGCFETLAGRVAIERDIRKAIGKGRKTILTEWIDGPVEMIRSGMLQKALDAEDKLVTEVLRRAGEIMGLAARTLRHIFEPDVIIFGGGLIEACGDFLMPIIEDAMPSDPYFGPRPGGRVVQSALGDDAGVLGAAALAMEAAGLDPFDGSLPRPLDRPQVSVLGDGQILVGEDKILGDVIVRVNGQTRPRVRKVDARRLTTAADVRLKDVRRACKGGPEVLLIAVTADAGDALAEEVQAFLRRRAIEARILPISRAAAEFADATARCALLLLTGVQESESAAPG
jgi:glucokinase